MRTTAATPSTPRPGRCSRTSASGSTPAPGTGRSRSASWTTWRESRPTPSAASISSPSIPAARSGPPSWLRPPDAGFLVATPALWNGGERCPCPAPVLHLSADLSRPVQTGSDRLEWQGRLVLVPRACRGILPVSHRVGPGRTAGSADPEEVLDGVALDAGEAVALGSGGLRIVILECVPVGEQLGVVLAWLQGRQIQVGDAGLGECFLDPRVGPEGLRPLAQGDVQLHIGERRLPYPLHALGPQRLVVEVPVAVVGRTAPRCTVLQQVHGGERLQ